MKVLLVETANCPRKWCLPAFPWENDSVFHLLDEKINLKSGLVVRFW